MNDARLWHPWLRINRVLRAILHEHWSAEAGEGTEDVRKAWTVTTPPRFAQSPRTRVHPARQGAGRTITRERHYLSGATVYELSDARPGVVCHDLHFRTRVPTPSRAKPSTSNRSGAGTSTA